MIRLFFSFAAGGLFGLGLLISQMTNPAKVLAFLDLFGAWDPSLAFVMGGALAVTALGYRFVLKQDKPSQDKIFHLPNRTDIDRRLILGAALFGIGWGLAGLCPGPAFSSLFFGGLPVIVFVIAMLIPMLWIRRRTS
jgi:hypothetical protein